QRVTSVRARRSGTGTYEAMRMRLGVIAVLVSAAAYSGSAAGGLPDVLLPDLDQRPPLAVSVRWGGPASDRHPRLVFTSSVENIGFGPLLVEGRRASTHATMRAAQLIERREGGFQRVDGVGRMRYNVNPSH